MKTQMPWLSRTVLHFSTWKIFALAMIASTLLSGVIFGVFGARWAEVANGLPVFDQLTTVTTEQLEVHLSLYTPAMKDAYLPLNLLDLIFPVVAGSVMLIGLGLIFKLNREDSLNNYLLEHGIFWLIISMPIVDWFENISFIILLTIYPDPAPLLSEVVTWVKLLKATVLYAGVGTIGILLVYNLFRCFIF